MNILPVAILDQIETTIAELGIDAYWDFAEMRLVFANPEDEVRYQGRFVEIIEQSQSSTAVPIHQGPLGRGYPVGTLSYDLRGPSLVYYVRGDDGIDHPIRFGEPPR